MSSDDALMTISSPTQSDYLEHHNGDENGDNNHTFTFDQGNLFYHVLIISSAMDDIGFGTYQLLLMQLCGGGWLFDGIELSLVSFIIPALVTQWGVTPVQSGAMASVVFLGMAIGAQFGGVISDRLGRKIVFIGSVFIVAIFGLASAFAIEYYSFLFLRLCVGLGLGACVPTDFSYLMEFIPRHNRGTILGVLNIYWSIGSILECLMAWACLSEGAFPPGQGWRYLVAFSSIPGFIMFFSRLLVSESPRFMLINGRTDEAINLVHRIAKWNRKPVPHGYLEAPHPDHKLAVLEQFKGLFRYPYLRVTLLLWPIWFMTSYGYVFFTLVLT
jgi:putative MFS transporter